MTYSAGVGSVALYFVGTAALVILYRFFLYSYFLSPLRLAPGPSREKLLKQLKQYGGLRLDLCRELTQEYGPIFHLAGGPIQGLMVSSPTAVQRVLVGNSTNYQLPCIIKKIVKWTLGGYFILPKQEFTEKRKVLSRIFSPRHLITTTEVYYNTSENLIKVLRSKIDVDDHDDGEVISINEWTSRVALDNVSEAIFGFKLDSLNNPTCELTNAFHEMGHLPPVGEYLPLETLVRIPGFLRLVQSDWVRHSTLWRRTPPGRLGLIFVFMRCLSTIRKASLEVKAKRMEENVANPTVDLISVLKAAQLSDCTDATSDVDIEGNITLFWSAGRAPVAMRISWVLWLLANDQQCQNRLRDEVTPLFARNSRPSYSSLDNLKWLDSVIMEALRLFSDDMRIREAENDDYLDGVFVPKGSLVILPLDLLNTCANIWGEDADEFNPTRWLDPTKKYKTSPQFLAFLGGPHRCIARAMAIMQLKIVVSSLITNFEFKPAHKGQRVEGNVRRSKRMVCDYVSGPSVGKGAFTMLL